MVNTFLPYSSIHESARVLDMRRLGKQRVEGLQILKANLGLTKGWVNHPAAVMWRGSDLMLAVYVLNMCDEWKSRGYVDNVAAQIDQLNNDFNLAGGMPWWMGNEEFHKSHQSNLMKKDPTHYAFAVDPNLPYLWPTETIGEFRVVEQKTSKINYVQKAGA